MTTVITASSKNLKFSITENNRERIYHTSLTPKMYVDGNDIKVIFDEGGKDNGFDLDQISFSYDSISDKLGAANADDYLDALYTSIGTSTNASPNAKILYKDYQASLADSASIDSGWIDMSTIDKYQISAVSSATGLTLQIQSRDDAAQTPLITNTTYSEGVFFMFNVIARQSEMRFLWINNTGSTVTNASLLVKGTVGGSDKLSVFPVSVQPSNFSQAALTQAITRGRTPMGVYEAVGVNKAGAMLTADFGTEVARNLYEGYSIGTTFGRNPDIDVGQTEDMWNGGGSYTGFDATAAEVLEVFSGSATDAGELVSSGTATGGSATTLIDSSATFVTDGVAVGDLVINVTKGVHGYVKTIDSETQVTVHRMTDGGTSPTNESGNTYKIASSTMIGAAVIKLENPLDGDYVEQIPEYVILNGILAVDTENSYMRCSKAKIVLAGSTQINQGTITVRQSSTVTNVMVVMPTFGQTTIGAFTVPDGKTCIIKRVRVNIVRSNGSAGSATIILYTRQRGGAWNATRVFEVQTGSDINFSQEGGIIVLSETDIKFTITNISDNNTIAEGAFEYYLINE